MSRKTKFLTHILLVTLFVSLGTVPALADPGISADGNFAVGADGVDGAWGLTNQLTLKLHLNYGEAATGTLHLDCSTPDPFQSASLPVVMIQRAYLDLDISSNLHLRVGRQKLNWGTGYYWNPANYIGSGKKRLEYMEDNPGVDIINTELTLENAALGWVLQPKGNWEDFGKTVKLSGRLLGNDVSASVFQEGAARGFGADIISPWWAFTLYGECAWKAGEHRLVMVEGLPGERSLDRFYFQGVAGISLLLPDLMVILEYYYNQGGWNEAESVVFHQYLNGITDSEVLADLSAQTGALLADLRRNYLFLSAHKTGVVEKLTLGGNVIYNLDDKSAMITPLVKYELNSYASAQFQLNTVMGEEGTEFGGLPFSSMARVKLVLIF